MPHNCKIELENYAINIIKNHNIDAVLMGHYHQLGIKKIDNGYFIHLGDWINQYTVTILDADGIWKQESWNQ